MNRTTKYLLIRYGRINNIGFFEHEDSETPKCNQKVIVKTEKGLEIGQLVGPPCVYKGGNFRLSIEQVKKYFDDSEIEFTAEPAGKLMRLASADDISEDKHLQKIGQEEKAYCQQVATEMRLSMKIVDVDHIFGGERIVFYFMADGRVDFRDLVKRIAHEYQTRIEMRQIGSRDEAKLFGDIETCGQECCCKKFLRALKPVNMRMAKMQKATLDPSKISGYCGRLKCCLRYEDENYSELKRNLPNKRTPVKTAEGYGYVLDGQILTQLVLVQLETGNRVAFPLEEIEILSPDHQREQRPQRPDNRDQGRRDQGRSRPDSRDNARRDNRRDNTRDNTRTNTRTNRPSELATQTPIAETPVSENPADGQAKVAQGQQNDTQQNQGNRDNPNRKGNRRRGRRPNRNNRGPRPQTESNDKQ